VETQKSAILSIDQQYGLLGYPLTHSFSKKYFSEKFLCDGLNATYDNVALQDIRAVRAAFAQFEHLKGFNVTIPHKTNILQYLDAITPEAAAIGAVNTVRVSGQFWEGHNTDVLGFEKALLEFLGANLPENALILGTGGAARAVKFVLEKLKIDYFSVSRTPSKIHEIPYAAVTTELLNSSRLIVHTTPLGMYPDTESCPPLPYQHLTPDHYLFDLVYNPEQTKFMELGREQGANVTNGLKMLIYQAEAAWEIWNSPLQVQS
jgi:shikimate dehydrogenase